VVCVVTPELESDQKIHNVICFLLFAVIILIMLIFRLYVIMVNIREPGDQHERSIDQCIKSVCIHVIKGYKVDMDKKCR